MNVESKCRVQEMKSDCHSTKLFSVQGSAYRLEYIEGPDGGMTSPSMAETGSTRILKGVKL